MYIHSGNVTWGRDLGQVQWFLRCGTELTGDLAIALLRVCPRELKTQHYINTSTLMFLTALFTVTK